MTNDYDRARMNEEVASRDREIQYLRKLRDNLSKEIGGVLVARSKERRRLAAAEARVHQLTIALQEALAWLYNPIKPDNQSAEYKRLKAILDERSTPPAGPHVPG